MDWQSLDYSTEENQQALRYWIAKLQGYTAMKLADNDRAYYLCYPNGDILYHGYATPEEALSRVPHVEYDLGEADALLRETAGVDWHLDYPAICEPTIYRIKGVGYSPYIEIYAAHSDPCIVRCLAYLAYVEWKQSQEVQSGHAE